MFGKRDETMRLIGQTNRIGIGLIAEEEGGTEEDWLLRVCWSYLLNRELWNC